MWEAIISIALKLVGFWITKKAKDEEVEKKFLELVGHINVKRLLSAEIKFERSDRLARLRKKRDENKKPNQ